jgi:CHASE2 domain-containing sensor protein
MARKTRTRKAAVAELPSSSPTQREASSRLRFWRWPILIGMMLVLLLALLFAQLARLGDAIDDRLRIPLHTFLGGQITRKFDAREISIILVDKDSTDVHPDPEDKRRNLPVGKPEGAHRHYHARLLKSLAGKAKIIVFDVDFSKPASNPQDDLEFSAAIEQTEQAGTRVLVAADLNQGEDAPRLAEPLKTVVKDHWGIWDGGRTNGKGDVVSIRLGLESPNQLKPHHETDEQLQIPSIALKAAAEFRFPQQNLQAFLDPLAQVVHLRRDGANGPIVKSIHVKPGCYLALSLAGKDELGRLNLYHEVYARLADLAEFNNKIVVIGYQQGDEQTVLDGEKRYGSEIQANAISNIMDDSFFAEVGFLYGAAAIVLLLVIGVVLRLGFGKLASYKVPLKLPFIEKIELPWLLFATAMLYLAVVVVAYLEHTVFSICYPLLALGLSYFLSGAVSSRLGFK